MHESLEAVRKGLNNLLRTIERIERISKLAIYGEKCDLARLEDLSAEGDVDIVKEAGDSQLKFLETLDDDFNTAGAISVLFQYCTALNRYIDQNELEACCDDNSGEILAELGRMITGLGNIIGILTEPLAESGGGNDELANQLMEVFIELRADARKDKNWALADAIRDKLKVLNITIEDRPDGAVWNKG